MFKKFFGSGRTFGHPGILDHFFIFLNCEIEHAFLTFRLQPIASSRRNIGRLNDRTRDLLCGDHSTHNWTSTDIMLVSLRQSHLCSVTESQYPRVTSQHWSGRDAGTFRPRTYARRGRRGRTCATGNWGVRQNHHVWQHRHVRSFSCSSN